MIMYSDGNCVTFARHRMFGGVAYLNFNGVYIELAIACLVVAGAAAVVVSVMIRFVRDRDKLGRKLRKTERALEKIRAQVAEKRGTIKQLQEEVAMLAPLEEKLRIYYDVLMEVQVEEERRAMEEEETTTKEREREERRRRLTA